MLTSGLSCLDLPNLSPVTRNVNLGCFEVKSWVWWPEVKTVLACPVLLPYLTMLIWKCDKCERRMFLLFVKSVSWAWSPKLWVVLSHLSKNAMQEMTFEMRMWCSYFKGEIGILGVMTHSTGTSDKLSLVIEYQHKCLHLYVQTATSVIWLYNS